MSNHVRNALYSALVETINSGSSVILSGPRLSGRSRLLARLAAEKDVLLRPTLIVRGIGRETKPLEAVRLALIESEHRTAKPPTDPLVALSQLVLDTDGPLAIDDAHRLDDESLLALERLARQTERPCILTTSIADARLRRAGVTLFPEAQQLPLSPLGIEDATTLVAGTLGGPPESAAAARILTQSGGIPGLIVALARDGRRSKALREENGVWTVQRYQWAAGESRTVLALLDDLTEGDVEQLTTLALVGRIHGETVEKILDRGALARLEQNGFLLTEAADDYPSRLHVSAYPELLAEHLRNRTSLFRRRELLASLSISLPQTTLDGVPTQESIRNAVDLDESTASRLSAYLAATIQQDISAQLAIRLDEWKNRRSLRDAHALLDLLVARGALREEVRTLLAEAHELPARNDRERTLFTIAEVRWLAFFDGDIDGAITLMEDLRTSVGPDLERALSATIRFLVSLTGGTADTSGVWMPYLDLEHPDLITAIEHLFDGRYAEAITGVPRGELASQSSTNLASFVHAFALTYRGDLAEAIEYIRGQLSDAVSRRDPEAIMLMSNVLAASYLFRGDHREAATVLVDALAIGYINLSLVTTHVSNLVMLSMIQASQGNRQGALTTYRQAEKFGIRDSYAPLGSPQLAAAFLAQIEEEPGADDQLWSLIVELLDRGYDTAALVAWMLAGPWSAERNERMAAVAAKQEGTLFPPMLRFQQAMTSGDPKELEASYEEFLSLDRGYYAVIAAARRSRVAAGRPGEYDHWVQTASDLARTLGINEFEVSRPPALSRLSTREREVFDMLTTGESNQWIADHLFLSVRTVENHVVRILRKLELRSRKEIVDLWG